MEQPLLLQNRSRAQATSIVAQFTSNLEAQVVIILPGWNSLDSVSAIGHAFQLGAIVFFALALVIELVSMFIREELHRTLQWVGIVFFFLCAGAEFVAYKYDVHREGLTETQHRGEIDEEKRQTAAQKQQTDDLRQQLEKSQQAVGQSSKDSDEAKRQAEQSAKDAAEAKRQAAEIKAANQPRRLSDSQKANMREFLTGQPTGTVNMFANLSATDASEYAGDFATILRNAGWKVDVKNVQVFPAGDAAPPRGLHVIIKERHPPIPAATGVLMSALRRSGIAFVYEYNEAMSDEIQITIDPK